MGQGERGEDEFCLNGRFFVFCRLWGCMFSKAFTMVVAFGGIFRGVSKRFGDAMCK